MKEIWKDIIGYENLYQVSNKGNVMSFISNKVLKPSINVNGYPVVNLYKNKKLKTNYIHALVAKVFMGYVSNGHKYLVVDHINNIKTDNSACNLQLITHRANISKGKFGTSKYTGVGWDVHANKWKAQIQLNGVSKHLGHFNNEKEAHLIYQEKLINHFKNKLD